MHRLIHRWNAGSIHVRLALTLAASLGCALAATGCGSNKKPPATSPSFDGGEDVPGGSKDDTTSGEDEKSEKKDECVGFDVANIEDLLSKSSCEEVGVKPDAIHPADLKGKLEVTLSSSPTKVGASGKADLLVTYANKSKDPLTLHFKIDPMPRFEVEIYDAKKSKRADLPYGPAPASPRGAAPPPSEVKLAHVTLAPNGTAHARVHLEAVKTRWAPEKLRGTPPERGFPRAPAGPLPRGKYNVRVVTPLVGVSEGVDHEMSAPRVEIQIGG